METETLAAAQQIDFSLLALFFRATLHRQDRDARPDRARPSGRGRSSSRRSSTSGGRATRRAAFDQEFWSGEPLDVVYERIGPDPVGGAARVFAAGMTEWRRSHRQDGGLIAGTQARIERAMNVAIQPRGGRADQGADASWRRSGRSRRSSGCSARSGASSTPSRRSRCSSRPTSPWWRRASPRRCWRPALGLLAAIPAVIFYNKLSQDADR